MRPLQVALSGDREVVITRSFNAPRELVWACHTRAELVRRWLLGPPGWTMPTCDIDLRVGGHYRYVWSPQPSHGRFAHICSRDSQRAGDRDRLSIGAVRDA
ncbi:MAG: SRPBCC domain-containing protein [Steroidobacteraceae bacterium]